MYHIRTNSRQVALKRPGNTHRKLSHLELALEFSLYLKEQVCKAALYSIKSS